MFESKSSLSVRKRSELIKLFVVGSTARAAGKVSVFGLLKRGVKVLVAIILDASTATLLPIIEEEVDPESIGHTDTVNAYNALDLSDFHLMRINRSKLFADKYNFHINGIKNFWNQAKRHLRRFNGIMKESFYWFLKERKWLFTVGTRQRAWRSISSAPSTQRGSGLQST